MNSFKKIIYRASIILFFIKITTCLDYQALFKLLPSAQMLESNGPNSPFHLLHKITTLLSPIENISKDCDKHLQLTVQGFIKAMNTVQTDGIKTTNYWEFKVFNAFGLPSGTSQLNLQWLGDFQTCLEINSPSSNLENHPSLITAVNFTNFHSLPLPPFYGEYCLITLRSTEIKSKMMPIRAGMCFPSTCSAEDKMAIVNKFFGSLSLVIEIPNDFCQSKLNPIGPDTIAVVMIVIITIILTMNAIVTLIDCIVLKRSVNGKQITDAKCLGAILQTFSITQNFKKMSSKNNSISIKYLNGFSLVATIWIFIGHAFLTINYEDIPYFNKIDFITTYEQFMKQYIFTYFFGFDVLFQITTILLTYKILSNFKMFGIVGIIPVFMQEVAKLLPTYLLSLAIMMGPISHVASGPLWPRQISLTNQCRDNWWKLLLFIFNFNKDTTECNPTFWYLSINTQLVLLSPLLIYPIHKKPKIGLSVMGFYWIVSIIAWPLYVFYFDITIVPSIAKTLKNEDTTNPNSEDLYKNISGHFAPILAGALIGYILHEHRDKLNNAKNQVGLIIAGWCVSILIIISLVYGTFPLVSSKFPLTTTINVVYACLATHLWSIGTSCFILTTAVKESGVINSFLQSTFIRVMGRSVYTAYLMHFFVISTYFHSTKIILYFDEFNKVVLSVTVITVSFILGTILTLTVEMPASNLIEMWLRKLKFTHIKQETSQRYKILYSDSSENELYCTVSEENGKAQKS